MKNHASAYVTNAQVSPGKIPAFDEEIYTRGNLRHFEDDQAVASSILSLSLAHKPTYTLYQYKVSRKESFDAQRTRAKGQGQQ